MSRLLRFLPLAIPVIVRFVRSPQGQSLVARLRARFNGSGSGSGAASGSPRR